MAGARIEIEIKTPPLDKAAQELSPEGLGRLLEEIANHVENSTRERAAREVAPDGTPWKALSPRYKRWKDKKRPGVPKLKFDLHMLGDRFSSRVDKDSALVGTNAKYGAIHQFGGTVDIPARQVQLHFKRDKRTGEVGNRFVKSRYSSFAQDATIPAHKVHIPARPYLGLSREDEEAVLEIVQIHLARMVDEAAT